jgi:hypothetical protein
LPGPGTLTQVLIGRQIVSAGAVRAPLGVSRLEVETELRPQRHRWLSPGWYLRRPHSQGCDRATCRSSGPRSSISSSISRPPRCLASRCRSICNSSLCEHRMSLLRCMSLDLALFCRANRAERCPQLGVERSQRGGRHWAVDDPNRTSGRRAGRMVLEYSREFRTTRIQNDSGLPQGPAMRSVAG